MMGWRHGQMVKWTEMWRYGDVDTGRNGDKHERWRSEEMERWTGRQMKRRRDGETGREGVGEVETSSRPCCAACSLCSFVSCPSASVSQGRAFWRHFLHGQKHGSSGVQHTGRVLGQGQGTVGWCQVGADRRAILAVTEWGARSGAACSPPRSSTGCWHLAPCPLWCSSGPEPAPPVPLSPEECVVLGWGLHTLCSRSLPGAQTMPCKYPALQRASEPSPESQGGFLHLNNFHCVLG